ncbi:MAG: SixA phosphatase family protein [Candidatus Kapaibacteriota bacterium]
MKRLIIARHAKSSWDNPEISDFERPLNKRGKRDAEFMSNLISSKVDVPDLIIASPALRAATTAKYFAEALNYDYDKIEFSESFYFNGSKYIVEKLKTLHSSINSVMIFGHNPDITSLASYFSGEFFDNVPTCGVVCLDFDIDNWAKIEEENAKIVFFEYPKKYLKNNDDY